MYGSSFFATDGFVEDAQIVSQTFKAPKNSVDPKLMDKIKNIRAGGYGKNLIEKNKYTVRGSLIGCVVFIGGAMIFRKNIWGFAILGISIGGLTGYVIGKAIVRHKTIKENTNPVKK